MSYVHFGLAQNDDQRQTLEAAERYLQLYNHDIERFVPERYTEDYRLYLAGAGSCGPHPHPGRARGQVRRHD